MNTNNENANDMFNDPNYVPPFAESTVNATKVAAASQSSASNNVTLTLGYEDTDFTRKYKFEGIATAALSSIASNVRAYNANVPEADKAVFVSDEGDSMTSIVSAVVEQVTTEYIIKR